MSQPTLTTRRCSDISNVPELYNALYRITEGLVTSAKRDGHEEMFHALREATDTSFVLDEHGEWSIGEVPFDLFPLPREARQRYFADLLSMPETQELCAFLLDRGFVERPTAHDSDGNIVESPSEQSTRWATCMYGGVSAFIKRCLQSIPTLHFDP